VICALKQIYLAVYESYKVILMSGYIRGHLKVVNLFSENLLEKVVFLFYIKEIVSQRF